MAKGRVWWQQQAVRAARVAVGLCFTSLGFALNLESHLGLGPLFVIQDGVAKKLGIEIGYAVIGIGLLMFVLSLLLREMPGLGTLVTVVGGGFVVNAVLAVMPDIENLPMRVIALLLSLPVMTFGGAMIMSARLGVAPLDAVMTGIYRRTPFSLYQVRVGLEVTMFLIGWALGGEVGIGCLWIGLGVGPFIQWWLHVLRAMPEKNTELLGAEPLGVDDARE
jgi:uncharacterized membrane protein YczE